MNEFDIIYCGDVALKDNGQILAGGYGSNNKGEQGMLVAQYNAEQQWR